MTVATERGYREVGLATYGNKCEICGHSSVEVHHIDYQEHQRAEDEIRLVLRRGGVITHLLEKAKLRGWLTWDGRQLGKNDSSTNLSVLCGNCHTLIHKIDVGMKLLNALTKRI
jgi:hypothetical protein